jgi:hypothetical protein
VFVHRCNRIVYYIESEDVLVEYLRVGSELQKDPCLKCIQEEITKDMDELFRLIFHFYYCTGSSGMGKTQLAFSLRQIPVIYLSFSDLQTVYMAFPDIRREIIR